jgi:hypothetical protein
MMAMLDSRAGAERRRALINTGALALALCWYILVGLTLTPGEDDFGIYRQGALSLVASGDPYLPVADPHAVSADGRGVEVEANRFIYPPLLAQLLRPFALIDERTGQLIWFLLNGAALAGLIALCIQLSRSQLAARYWGLVALGTLIAPPTRLCLQLGQTGILLALLMVAGLALARRFPAVSGLALALASLIKLYPAFLGLFYALRRPRGVLWWTIGSGAAVLLVSLAGGPETYLSYTQRLLTGSYHPYGGEFNTALYGVWTRLFVPNHFGIAVVDLPGLARALMVVGGIVVVALCARAGAAASEELAAGLQFGVWLCGMMLVTPLNGVYNLTLLLFPLLTLLRYLELYPDRRVRAWLVAATALVCVPPLWSTWWPALDTAVRSGWGQLFVTPPLYGLLAYFALCFLIARRLTASARRPARSGAAVPEPAASRDASDERAASAGRPTV